MSNHYYLDTNALVKYSCYQDYKSEPEYGVKDVRNLINKREDIFYLSHLTLWEFYQVLLKIYRANPDKIFGNNSKDSQKNFERIIFELQSKIKSNFFEMVKADFTNEVLIEAQKLMFEYGLRKRISLDSIDALHIAFTQHLIKKYSTNITIITADEIMMETCQSEGIEVLFIQKPLANPTT